MAAFSRYPQALDWARQRAESVWGPIVLTSPTFEFAETEFYERTMGHDLRKLFWAFDRLIDPGSLADRKLQTNDWEDEFQRAGTGPEARLLNLDPGYLTEAKLILASTKDRDHRIYLDRGIFAENTLFYQQGAWQARPWTYPDYRRSDYHQFFETCRRHLRARYQELDCSSL